METGIHDIEWDNYLSLNALNQSRLKKILVAPRLFDHTEDRDTPSLDTGRIIHDFLEHKSIEQFAVAPKVDRRTTAGKEAAAAFIAANEGKICISGVQMDLIERVADGFNGHEHASKILHNSIAEKTAIAKIDGILCKGRFDLIQQDLDLVVDVKTTRRTSKREFERDCISYGYPFQLAFYEKLYEEITGRRPHTAIITIETAPPYELSLYYPNEEFLQYGRDRMSEAFEIYQRCKELGHFPIKQSGGQGEDLGLPWTKKG